MFYINFVKNQYVFTIILLKFINIDILFNKIIKNRIFYNLIIYYILCYVLELEKILKILRNNNFQVKLIILFILYYWLLKDIIFKSVKKLIEFYFKNKDIIFENGDLKIFYNITLRTHILNKKNGLKNTLFKTRVIKNTIYKKYRRINKVIKEKIINKIKNTLENSRIIRKIKKCFYFCKKVIYNKYIFVKNDLNFLKLLRFNKIIFSTTINKQFFKKNSKNLIYYNLYLILKLKKHQISVLEKLFIVETIAKKKIIKIKLDRINALILENTDFEIIFFKTNSFEEFLIIINKIQLIIVKDFIKSIDEIINSDSVKYKKCNIQNINIQNICSENVKINKYEI